MTRRAMNGRTITRSKVGRTLTSGLVALVIALVALPAGEASAAVGVERPVSDPVMQTPTLAFSQRNVDAVFDGTRWFVVWAENRGGGLDIMGARVGTDGSMPDGDGITISTGVGDGTSEFDSINPSVDVDDDGQFLVVWTDGGPSGSDIFAARVSSAGRVLDPAAITIDADADADSLPSVAWNGQAFFVSYQRSVTPARDTFGALVTSAGVAQPLGMIVAGVGSPTVSASGSSVLIIGTTTVGIVGRRFNASGVPLDTQPFLIVDSTLPGSQIQPTAAGANGGWLAAWSDGRNGAGNLDIYGARITLAGAVTDPNGIQVSGASGNQDLPEVGVVGGKAVAIWRDLRDGEQDVFGAHVSFTTGAVQEVNGFAVSASAASDIPEAVTAAPGSNHAAVVTRDATEAPFGGAQRAFVRQISPK